MIKNSAGFTLVEILVVIGIIAVLATIVIVAINPARQFAQARNTQRESNINTILNAIGQNSADNKGIFTCSSVGVSVSATTTAIGSGSVNLASCLVPTYIPSMGMDPDGGTTSDTGYTIAVNAFGRYTVCAPKSSEAALGSPAAICVTR